MAHPACVQMRAERLQEPFSARLTTTFSSSTWRRPWRRSLVRTQLSTGAVGAAASRRCRRTEGYPGDLGEHQLLAGRYGGQAWRLPQVGAGRAVDDTGRDDSARGGPHGAQQGRKRLRKRLRPPPGCDRLPRRNRPRVREGPSGSPGERRGRAMATMVDVAAHAGVSVATVSHVLNDTRRAATPPRPSWTPSTRSATRPTPSPFLVTARTRSIGLAVSAISNSYFTEICSGRRGVRPGAPGYGLLLADPRRECQHERKVVQLLARRVDGLIVSGPFRRSGRASALPRAAQRTDRLPGSPGGGPGRAHLRFDQGLAENAEPMARLVGHLAERGHRRIGLVAGLPGLAPRTSGSPATDTAWRAPGCPTTNGSWRTATPRRRPPNVPPTRCPWRRPRPRWSPETRDDHQGIVRPRRTRSVRAGRPGAVLLRRLPLG